MRFFKAVGCDDLSLGAKPEDVAQQFAFVGVGYAQGSQIRCHPGVLRSYLIS